MAMKLHGMEVTLSTFREVDRRFTQAAGKALEEGAKNLSALARAFAPIDREDLVNSIRAERVPGTNSTSWRIKVGGTIGGRNVTQYATRVHETFQITRGGQTRGAPGTNPGLKSQAKASATGHAVGGKFLSRAFRRLRPEIERSIQFALRNEISRISARVTRYKKK